VKHVGMLCCRHSTDVAVECVYEYTSCRMLKVENHALCRW
jgi:hypothetical protein